jgi:hypothetical protein
MRNAGQFISLRVVTLPDFVQVQWRQRSKPDKIPRFW